MDCIRYKAKQNINDSLQQKSKIVYKLFFSERFKKV